MPNIYLQIPRSIFLLMCRSLLLVMGVITAVALRTWQVLVVGSFSPCMTTYFPAQLADCLGSIVGIAFQHVSMRISTDVGATVLDIHVPNTWNDDDGFVNAEVGALPEGMKRDILFELLLLPQEPGHTDITFEVSAGGVHASKTLTIDRPAVLHHLDPDPPLHNQVARRRKVAPPSLLALRTEVATAQVSTSTGKGVLLNMHASLMDFAS